MSQSHSQQPSFHEILQRKIAQQNPKTETVFSSTHIDSPVMDWIHSIQASVFNSKNWGINNYQRSQTKAEKASESTTASSHQKAATPPAQTASWSFEEQLAIDQLIRLGGDIQLNSPFEQIKKAYKKLVRKFHPDLNQSQSCDEKLSLVIDCFRILENSPQKS